MTEDDKQKKDEAPTTTSYERSHRRWGMPAALVAVTAFGGASIPLRMSYDSAAAQYAKEHPFPHSLSDDEYTLARQFEHPARIATAKVLELEGAKVKKITASTIEDIVAAYTMLCNNPVTTDKSRGDLLEQIVITNTMGIDAAANAGLNPMKEDDRALVKKMVDTYTAAFADASAQKLAADQGLRDKLATLQSQWKKAQHRMGQDGIDLGAAGLGATGGAVAMALLLYFITRGDRKHREMNAAQGR